MVPLAGGGGAAPPRPAAAPAPARPAPPQPGRPASARTPAQTTPRPAARPAPAASTEGRPPLYPLDESGARKPAPFAAPAPKSAPAESAAPAQPPIPASLEQSGELFGVSLRQQSGDKLFGEDASDVEVGELFADSIPGKPEVDDDLDVPLHSPTPTSSPRPAPAPVPPPKPATPPRPATKPAPESDAAPIVDDELDLGAPDDAAEAEPVVSNKKPESSEDLISMDDLFSSKSKPTATPAAPGGAPPSFGKGPLPAPFLKPVAEPAASPAPSGVCPPFQLVSVEGIPDAIFDLTGGGNYLIGRDKDAEVKILSNSVSRKHARIDATGKDAVLIDLGSANGTQVNGTSVSRHPLREGDEIKMGKVILRFTRPS
jgi:hypothetical protein